MKRWVIVLGLALALCAQAVALAQAKPDFSGTWRFNQDKSGKNIAGNWPVVPFPSQIAVKQTPTELQVEWTSLRQEPLTADFKLDGSRVTLKAPEGISETGEARLEGATMVITSRRSFSMPGGGEVVTDTKETSNRSVNALTVVKTRLLGGESHSDKAVYDKIR
jgi:hypothetical protein